MQAIATTSAPMDASQFDNFEFPDPSLEDEGSVIFVGDPESAADAFPTSSEPPSHLPQQQNTPSAPTHASAPSEADTNPRRRSIAAGSDDGSQGSGPNGGTMSFEDVGGDEFGLSTRGVGDGSDLGGKSKGNKAGSAIPAWSELKTKAGKERKRLPLACIACRRKKIRCSGEKPACKHCLRSRIPCVYKVTARKAAPRTDYMAMLDKRLKRMEERIIKIVPLREQDAAVSSVARAVVKPSIPGATPAAKSGSKKRQAEEAFGQDLDNWARGSSKDKNDPQASNKPTSLKIQEAEENKLFRAGLDALPPRDIQEHLAEVFFENIYGQAYHLLHKPSYMRKLRAGTLPPVLVLSVCAVAARFSTHPKLSSNTPNFLRGEEWASHAREICVTRYEWPNITILTCLLILGLHEFGTCHGGRSWALGGQAIRMAFALQLHKDLEHDPLTQKNGNSQLSFIDREVRRRTMWSCFLMDRFNSSGTDRPVFMKEENIKIPLPIKEKFFQLDMPAPTETLHGQSPFSLGPMDEHFPDPKENIGVAAYMIRSIALWGRVITYLNQGGKDLDPHPIWSPHSIYAQLTNQAEDLLRTLPDTLKYSRDNITLHDTDGTVNQYLFLHISIQQNILFLHRVAVAAPGATLAADIPRSFVAEAGAKTFAAANRISEVLKDSEPYLVAAPFVGYCAFSSATIHVIGIFSGNPSVEVASKRNLTINVKYLSKMKRYWGMFHFMSENLREQYRSCADAARHGRVTESATASPIFQYGDWFDRYPHGVSQTDFIDPVSLKHEEKGQDAVLEQKAELHTVEELFTSLSPSQQPEGPKDAAKQPPQKKKTTANRKITVSSGSANAQQRSQPQAPQQSSQKSQQQAQQPQQQHQQQQQQQQQQQHQLEPLMTDLRNPAITEAQSGLNNAGLAQGGRMSGQVGAQANGPAPFNSLAMSQPQGNSFHAMSPISPMAVNQFAGNPHHQAAASPFYSQDLLSLSLNQQANNMLQPLDRQLVFGGYSMEPGHLAQQQQQAMLGGVNNWNSLAGNPQTPSMGQQAGSRPGMGPRMGSGGMQGVSQLQQHQQAAFGGSNTGGNEASTAWFMPFNMEPPEIGGDFGGMSLDGLMMTPNSPSAGSGQAPGGGVFSSGF